MTISLGMDISHKMTGGTCPIYAIVSHIEGNEGRQHVWNATPAWWRISRNKRMLAAAFLAGMKTFGITIGNMYLDTKIKW